jgi:hypothetical protein
MNVFSVLTFDEYQRVAQHAMLGELDAEPMRALIAQHLQTPRPLARKRQSKAPSSSSSAGASATMFAAPTATALASTNSGSNENSGDESDADSECSHSIDFSDRTSSRATDSVAAAERSEPSAPVSRMFTSPPPSPLPSPARSTRQPLECIDRKLLVHPNADVAAFSANCVSRMEESIVASKSARKNCVRRNDYQVNISAFLTASGSASAARRAAADENHVLHHTLLVALLAKKTRAGRVPAEAIDAFAQ